MDSGTIFLAWENYCIPRINDLAQATNKALLQAGRQAGACEFASALCSPWTLWFLSSLSERRYPHPHPTRTD